MILQHFTNILIKIAINKKLWIRSFLINMLKYWIRNTWQRYNKCLCCIIYIFKSLLFYFLVRLIKNNVHHNVIFLYIISLKQTVTLVILHIIFFLISAGSLFFLYKCSLNVSQKKTPKLKLEKHAFICLWIFDQVSCN